MLIKVITSTNDLSFENLIKNDNQLGTAIKAVQEGMKGTMADYVIASIAETAIMDVYPYSAEPDVKPEFPDADKR